MPFGSKADPTGLPDIDFNRIYEAAIKPAIEAAGMISLRADDENGGADSSVRVFAGQRSDPFFLDVRMIEKTAATGKLSFKPKGSDTLYGTNILAIVLKLEWRKVLEGGPLFAVVCETLASGKRPVRIERVGRPEIKNVTLSWKQFDQVNRNLEIRDLYNSEDAFNLKPDYFDVYRTRMNANLAFHDGLDGKSIGLPISTTTTAGG